MVTDVVTAMRASWGVASSPPMPRWREWMAHCARADAHAPRRNPPLDEIERAVVSVARGGIGGEALPWDAMRAPRSRRLYAGLVSFVDDYAGPYPEELFPPEEAVSLRRALLAAGPAPLTLAEQLTVASAEVGGRTFAAAVLLHAVTRAVARNRDRRALGDLPWTVRLRETEWVAPFPAEVAGRGDPPGDTYHYWANFVVGLHVEMRGRLGPRALGATFRAGPFAMTWIRGGLFGRTLFAGAHAACDRAGLRHGRAAARAMGRRS
jgi:hypothetical protein